MASAFVKANLWGASSWAQSKTSIFNFVYVKLFTFPKQGWRTKVKQTTFFRIIKYSAKQGVNDFSNHVWENVNVSYIKLLRGFLPFFFSKFTLLKINTTQNEEIIYTQDTLDIKHII